jgi:hypothetical protein
MLSDRSQNSANGWTARGRGRAPFVDGCGLQAEPYPLTAARARSPRPPVKAGRSVRKSGSLCRVHLLLTSGDPSARIAELRSAVASVDLNLPLPNVSTIGEDISWMMGNDELSSSLTGILAILALVLAAIELYGVMRYNVAQRTNDIGVRLALAAQKQNVLWIILREALLLFSAGVVWGCSLVWRPPRLEPRHGS